MDTLAEQQAFEDHRKGREAGEPEGGDGYAAHFDGDEEADPVAGQQHTTEQQAARILAAHALPARAGQAGEQGQGEYGEGGATEDNDRRAGAGGQFAEDAGKAEEQRANVQCAEGGAVVHDGSLMKISTGSAGPFAGEPAPTGVPGLSR